MKLIDIFYKPRVYDAYTFVFDEQDTQTSYFTMLALSEDGHTFSQWTEGVYDPIGDNEHLGQRVVLSAVGAAALDGFFHRLSIPDEWEGIHATVEQLVQERDE